MTQAEQASSEEIKTAHDVEAVRAKYSAVLGRDNILRVFWQAFVKILLKTFSWSAWWAIHGCIVVDDYVKDMGDKGAELSWLPFTYAACGWMNFLLRPQFKRLVEAAAKALENWKA